MIANIHLKFLFFVIVLIGSLRMDNSFIDSEEWSFLKKRVNYLIEKNDYFEDSSQYELYPIFWLESRCANSSLGNEISIDHLCFTYYPKSETLRYKKYAKCTVLISKDDTLVGIANALLAQPLKIEDIQYRRVLEYYISNSIDVAFYYYEPSGFSFEKIYCIKDDKLKTIITY